MLIDTYAAEWFDELGASGSTYLLLDGAFIPGFHKRFDEEAIFLFQPLPGWRDAVREVSPFIIRFDSKSQRLKQALKECNGWPMISAFKTREPLNDFAERLSRWCVVEAGGQHINLRFPDTRRLPDIYRVMSDEQRSDMFGPAEHCVYLGRDGLWRHIALDTKIQASPVEQKLTDTQFEELLSCSEGDSMLAQLERRLALNNDMPRSAQYSAVCAAIALGKAQKLERNDLLDLCEQTIARPEQTTYQVG